MNDSYIPPTYVYLDTEFYRNDFTRRGTVSLSLSTKNAAYYAVNADMDFNGIFFLSEPEVAEWMRQHVMVHLPTIPSQGPFGVELDLNHRDVKTPAVISAEMNDFVRAACPRDDKDDIEVIVNSGAQDMVRFHTFISGNDWGLHEPWIPRYADDIARIKRRAYQLGVRKEELPVQPEETLHHPLYDAQHEMRVHEYILSRVGVI